MLGWRSFFSATSPSLQRAMSARFFASSSETTRGPYGHLQDSDISVFERIIGRANVKTEGLHGFNNDWMGQFKGNSKCVLLPATTEEVSALLQHCYHQRLAVVPQSGNTGLVGGSVPVFDEVILSLRRIRNFFNLDNASGK